MPNHIQNKLSFTCTEERLKAILADLATTNEEEGHTYFDFNKVIKMPDDIFKGALGTAERKKYGERNWYDWSIENWGTKWNAYNTDVRDDGTLCFWTAWSAPMPVIEALAEKYPDVDIHHEWADEDMGRNCGIRDYHNGYVADEYIPMDYQNGMKLALSVWDYCPEDVGLVFDENGDLVEIEEQEEGDTVKELNEAIADADNKDKDS